MRRFPRLISATARDHGDLYLYNRPGTLCLRTTFCREYNPKVLNNDWYEHRMSEPLDFDPRELGNRCSNRSSYRNFWFGDPNAPLPKSTTHEMMEESLDWWGKKKLVRLPYLCPDNFDRKDVKEKGVPEKLPRLKTTMQTTEKRPVLGTTTSDYKLPSYFRNPTEPVTSHTQDLPWMKYRPVHSKSTSTDDHNHEGIPSWQEEDCKHSQHRCRPKQPEFIFHPEDPRLNRL